MWKLIFPTKITVLEVNPDDLPEEWDSEQPTITTQTIGDDFIYNNDAAILKVPSSIIPQEFNYVINPNYKDFRKIKVIKTSKMTFDSRFIRA